MQSENEMTYCMSAEECGRSTVTDFGEKLISSNWRMQAQ